MREATEGRSIQREYPMHTRDMLREESPGEDCKDRSPAECAASAAQQAAEDLRDTVSRLIVRLQPVLVPRDTVPSNGIDMAKPVEDRGHSSIVAGFENLESTMTFVTQRLSNAIGCLEI